MAIFTETLRQDLSRVPGASHAFLRELYTPQATPHREALEQAVDALPAWLRGRVADPLRSVDNRRFFQGYAELTCAHLLLRAGYTLDAGDAGASALRARRPDGRWTSALPLGFVHSARQPDDLEGVRRLQAALTRVSSRLRFAVYVRKWLPAGFPVEHVRQAVELWLREVEAGNWEGRFAAYEDEHVVLEFGLTGERNRPGRPPVVMTLGPFLGGRAVDALERRLVQELDRHRLVAGTEDSVLVCAVADQPLGIGRGYLRELLYGKPRWVAVSGDPEGHGWEAGLSPDAEPCLFKDPVYRGVIGLALLERVPGWPMRLTGRACSNPLSVAPLLPGELRLRTVAQDRVEDGRPVIRWFETDAPPLDLTARG